MKKFAKTILTVGLLASTSLFAGDGNSAFYPIENNDTPDYLLDNEINDHSNNVNVLAKSTINKDALIAFFPIENNDAPDYILNNTSDKQVKTTYVLAKSSISESILCSIYPEEHTDSPRISC